MRRYIRVGDMRIITKARLREFWTVNKDAENSMREWVKVVSRMNWKTSADVKNTFNATNIYKDCTIFDVGGNKYRIIAKVEYRKHIVFIRFVLTHSEYDEKKWQSDC
jgi:mRNA interferase HigB